MKNRSLVLFALLTAVALVVSLSASAQMGAPAKETLKGKVIDLTCASKAKATMDSWTNADNDEHMTPEGKKPGCATMCLKGGQPAALFAGGKVVAALACNPRATLADYAAKDVELEGFWGGSKKDDARSFIPEKIRTPGGEWQTVDCATMHDA